VKGRTFQCTVSQFRTGHMIGRVRHTPCEAVDGQQQGNVRKGAVHELWARVSGLESESGWFKAGQSKEKEGSGTPPW
jgi:hypothetical protein